MLYRCAEEPLPESKSGEQRDLLGFSDIHTTSDTGHYLAVVTLVQMICVLGTMLHRQLDSQEGGPTLNTAPSLC